jgi:subtilisin family serine protease
VREEEKKKIMFATTRRVLTSLVLITLSLILAFSGVPRRAAATDTGQVAVIVELKDEPAAIYAARARQAGRTISNEELQSQRESLRAAQNDFLASLASRGVSSTVMSRDIKNYDGSVAATLDLRYTLVFNGLALVVPRAALSTLRAMPEVKSVRPNGVLYTQLNRSVDYIGAPRVYGASKELSQFDDLREGYEGQGMYVAIIDSGVDWTHPMFGGDPTPPRLGVAPVVAAVNTNKKVVYSLPLTDIGPGDGFGHGTHVASTAAGYLAQAPGADGLPNTADDVRLHGVAPQAKIMSYTVCSTIQSTVSQVQPIGGCASADTIMALEDAVSPFTVTGQPKPVAHVINLSLGGSGGPDNPTAVACSNAALTGATVVAASGNSGPGEGTTGSPAAGRHVISVGATTHPGAANSSWSADVLQASSFPSSRIGAVSPAKSFPTVAGFSRLKLYPMAGTPTPPASSMAQRYVLVNNPLVAWPASVAGRIALVKDSGLASATFFDISNMAAASGAVGVILFGTTQNPTAVTGSIPSAIISPEEGEILVDALSSTDNNNVDPPNGALSELPVRMNPVFTDSFMGEMAGFSSRGPVQGLGQIKPDVSAPGVAVLAAVPPASVLGALAAAAAPTSPNYYHLDGTSMASPHVAGAATLVKQAHLNWTPDMIRTAFINTATNMRSDAGAPKADGLAADSIIAQGGGLIDVYEALNAKALMGVAGDGIDAPAILGSHSYGEVPVINSRVTHTTPITVTVRDLSGQGGTYQLGVANNRDLQLAGISVSTSQTSVTVPANGEATFVVNATVDGDRLRDIMADKTGSSPSVFERIQMQWFVTARRADGGESLRMPFFFRPASSLPAQPTVVTRADTVVVPVGDAGQQLASGVTYVDVPFEVDASTYKVEATTEWFEAPAGDQPDLDYQLLNPAGQVIASSGAPGGPEFVSVRVTEPGTYTHRIVGFVNAATEATVTTELTKGNAPPASQPVAGDFRDAQNRAVDFDGAFTLSWQPSGGERGFEVERSSDNGASWQLIGTAAAGATSLALGNEPNGVQQYRVRGLHTGQIGLYVTPASAAQTVVVDRRTQADITSLVRATLSNITFTGGVFQLDQVLTNQATETFLPRLEMKVVRINSASGTVTVANADNGGSGVSATNAALFGYSNLIGAEQEFTPAETTGARTLRFNDPAAELFTYDMQVTAYRRAADAGATTSGATDGGSAGGTSSASGTSDSPLLPVTSVLRVTANPLTKTVGVKLVGLLP